MRDSGGFDNDDEEGDNDDPSATFIVSEMNSSVSTSDALWNVKHTE